MESTSKGSYTEVDPKVKWAIDLLTPDPNYEENFLSKNYPWIVLPFTTVGGTLFLNYIQYRPWWSSK